MLIYKHKKEGVGDKMEIGGVWVVRQKPTFEKQFPLFLEEGIIALGWSELTDVTKMDKKELMEELKKTQTRVSDRSVALQANMIKRFTDEIKVGDIIFVPDNEKIHIARVLGDYQYFPEKIDDNFPHQRKVEWLEKNVPFNKIPNSLKPAFRPRLTLYSLVKYGEAINEWLKEEFSFNLPIQLPERFEDALRLSLIEIYGPFYDHPYLYDLVNLAEESIPEKTLEEAENIAYEARILIDTPFSHKYTGGKRNLIDDSFDSSVQHDIDGCVEIITDLLKKGKFEKELEEAKNHLIFGNPEIVKFLEKQKKEMLKILEKGKKEKDFKPIAEKLKEIEKIGAVMEEGEIKKLDFETYSLKGYIDQLFRDKLEDMIEEEIKNDKFSYLLFILAKYPDLEGYLKDETLKNKLNNLEQDDGRKAKKNNGEGW